jgi:segregation and condensation protein A
MSYPVRLEVFEGPLDLLLYLVSKERVDVADITISSITEEYLQALTEVDVISLDAASGFLVLAATLLELKSLKLLPGDAIEDPEVARLLEERDHLLHRLIEYSTFKGAAEALAMGFERNRSYYHRAAQLPEELSLDAGDLLRDVSPSRLWDVAVQILSVKEPIPVDTSFVTPVRVNVREILEKLAEDIRRRGTASFDELCRKATSRVEVIVRFLGLLELLKLQSVDVQQEQPFEEILVRWRQPKTGSGIQ